jgi:hypothetical protein
MLNLIDKQMRKFAKYSQNLRRDENFIYSYGTQVAEIDHVKREVTPLSWWSVTTSKHINYAAKEMGMKVIKN